MKKPIVLLLFTMFLHNLPAQCWQTLAYGHYHSLGIKADGTLWAWGNNDIGQLGTGDLYKGIDEDAPVKIGNATNWKMVAAGKLHSLAIKTDGTLWAWGANSSGQLGDTTFLNYLTIPTRIGTETDWKFIAAHSDQSYAIKTDGTLWGWGYNSQYQLGDSIRGYKRVPAQIGSDTTWEYIVAGKEHVLGKKTNNTFWAWGFRQLKDSSTAAKSPAKIMGSEDWVSVSTGFYHSLAIKNDGTMWLWGDNSYNQLGDGTFKSKKYPEQLWLDSDWKSVIGGEYFTVAIKTDGSLYAFGFNKEGQLGTGDNGSRYIPTRIGDGNDWEKVIAAGASHVVVQKKDGSFWAWGRNDYGQLGDLTGTGRNLPALFGCGLITLSSKETNEQEQIFVYPNPTTRTLTIKTNGEYNFNQIIIKDIVGKTITQLPYSDEDIDVTSLSPGTYLILLEAPTRKLHTIFIKQ